MKERNLNLFYSHQLFFAISESMLSFVLVLFIYHLFNSISAVFFFNAAWSLLYLLIFVPIFNMGQKLGRPKYFMAMGMVFYVLALTTFSLTTTESIYLFYPGIIFFLFYIAFYWPTRHWFFSVMSDYEKVGKQVSNLWAIMLVISVVSPIVAGALAYFVSFNASFVMGAIAGFLAIIPILFFKVPPHETHYSTKHVLEILRKPEVKAIRWAYIWEGVSSFSMTIGWTLAFAIFIGDVATFGTLVGVSTLIAAVLSKAIGIHFDKRKRLRLLKQSTYADAIAEMLYLGAYFFPNMVYIYFAQSMAKFTGIASLTVNDSYLYAYSNKVHPMYFHFNREIFLTLSRLICNSVLGVAFLLLPPKAIWLLIPLGAIAKLGWLQLGKSDHLLH